MRAPRTLTDLRSAYADYQARGGALPLLGFAEQVGYTLAECLAAEALPEAEGVGGDAGVGLTIELPDDGGVVEVTAAPEAIETVTAPKRKRAKRKT